MLQKISSGNPAALRLFHSPTGQTKQTNTRVTAMNFNLFSVIAASAISATVVLPAGANVEIADKKSHTQSYTQKYLQQSANFYAALDHKTQA
jgi:hypothetical protein